ncbi:hypothetical protein GS534_00750 [Rhodococcus hoagii]|nr:hypothetical protein [Prescottella equi]
MKSVRDAFVNLWRRLDWFDRIIAFIFALGAGFSAVVGDAMSATWFAVVLVLWCCAAYWRNAALDHRSEIEHLRIAMRDTLRRSEFTIQKPIECQVTVGGKAPEWQPNRDVVAAVEAAEADWRDAATKRAKLLENIDVPADAADDARLQVQAAEFALNHARENAANELARLSELLDKTAESDQRLAQAVVEVRGAVEVQDPEAAVAALKEQTTKLSDPRCEAKANWRRYGGF